jgi:hypothetical protein
VDDLDSLAAFLASLDDFRTVAGGLGPADLRSLAAVSELWSFEAGDIVAFPDERPNGDLVVMEGCLVLLSKGTPNVFLGVRERLDPSLEGLWKGQTAGRYLVIPDAHWRSWLRSRPEFASSLGLEPGLEVPRLLHKQALRLQEGEVLRHIFRRSPWFLARRIALPATLGSILAVFCMLIPFPLAIFPLAGTLTAVALVALFLWEWRVSVMAVTDRAVLVRQVDAWQRRADFEKLALDRLKVAVFSKQGVLDRLFGLVAVELEGDSPKGRLIFAGLRADTAFLEATADLKAKRAKSRPDRRAIRGSLASRGTGAHQPQLLWGPKPEVPTGEGALSFRRHPYRLLLRLLPWAGWLGLVVAVASLGSALAGSTAALIWSLASVMALVPLGRLAYEVADWSDDKLLLEGDKVICLHRKPLWGGEIRQEGQLSEVQQVGVRKDTLAGLLFDFGTVTVSLGSSSALEFEYAAHPDGVQAEVFERRARLLADLDREEALARLDQMSEVLDTWEEAKKAGYFREGR